MIYGSIPGVVTLGGFLSQIRLTAQSMLLIPVASPCYDPCTMTVTVTWVNNTSGILPAGQLIGITVDGIMSGSTTTTLPIDVGETISHTFTVTGMTHLQANLVCPIPN